MVLRTLTFFTALGFSNAQAYSAHRLPLRGDVDAANCVNSSHTATSEAYGKHLALVRTDWIARFIQLSLFKNSHQRASVIVPTVFEHLNRQNGESVSSFVSIANDCHAGAMIAVVSGANVSGFAVQPTDAVGCRQQAEERYVIAYVYDVIRIQAMTIPVVWQSTSTCSPSFAI